MFVAIVGPECMYAAQSGYVPVPSPIPSPLSATVDVYSSLRTLSYLISILFKSSHCEPLSGYVPSLRAQKVRKSQRQKAKTPLPV